MDESAGEPASPIGQEYARRDDLGLDVAEPPDTTTTGHGCDPPSRRPWTSVRVDAADP